MKKKSPSCDDYMRMSLSQEVIDHIRTCEDCRALVNALTHDADRRVYEFEHRN